MTLLWQYIDAKYFLRLSKNELFNKIHAILNQIEGSQISNDGAKNANDGPRTLKKESLGVGGKYLIRAKCFFNFEGKIEVISVDRTLILKSPIFVQDVLRN